MKVLLSPAKKLDFDPHNLNLTPSKPILEENAEYLAKKLKSTSAKKISEMMSLSQALTELNVHRYKTWTESEQKEAILAFNGDVYLGLGAKNWSEKELLASQNSIRIISGLYGILKPLDLIKPYRLEMGSKWNVTPAKKNLYQYWKSTIATQLESEMTENEPILNLASHEYSKAILPHIKKKRKVVTAEFRDFKNGELKMIQIFVKKARGMMAKFVVKNGIEQTEDVITFKEDGYAYDANISDENKLVFTR